MSRSSICSTDSFLWVKYLLSCVFVCWEAFVGKAKAKAKKKTTGARAKRDRRRKLATEAPASAEELLASVRGSMRCRMFQRSMTCRSMRLSRLPSMTFARMPRSPSRCSLVPWCAWTAGFRW